MQNVLWGKLLLVEADPDARKQDLERLRTVGYETTAVSSEEAACELLSLKPGIGLVLACLHPASAERIMMLGLAPVLGFLEDREPEYDPAAWRYGCVTRSSGVFILRAALETAIRLFKAETQASESGERFRLLFQNMNNGFALHEVILDDEGRPSDYRFLEINPAYERLTGLSASKLIGHTVREVLPGTEESWIENFSAVALGAGPMQIENYSRELGRYYQVTVYSPEHGRFAVIFQDVTESKMAMEEIKRKTEELDVYFNISLDLFAIADPDGHFLRLNPAWCATLGYDLSELLGHPYLDFVHPEDLQKTNETRDSSANQDIFTFVNRYRCKNGEYRWLEWRSRPSGGLVYATARDITERKLADARIAQLIKEKETLFAELTHRVKNTMAMMESLMAMQLETLGPGPAADALRSVRARVSSMALLYEKLNKTESFDNYPIGDYLPGLVREIVALYPKRDSIMLDIRVEDFSLPLKTLSTLGLLVNELITNALKYAFEGRTGGTIRVSAQRKDERILICVADDGIGLPASPQVKEGSGLGLELVQMLCAQLEGELKVETGEGTWYWLKFSAE